MVRGYLVSGDLVRGSGGVAEVGRMGGGATWRKDAQRAVGLLRVNPRGQVMRLGAGLKLAQCFGINAGIPYVQFQVQVVLQGVCALNHHVEGLDAVHGDVAFGENLGLCVIEIHTDKNAELIGQDVVPFLRGCDAAAGEAATLRPVADFLQPQSG